MAKVNLFAWASISEQGTVNGKVGDQTGREVKIGNYYYFGQDVVVRFKSVLRGRKAAKIAKQLANNKAIGYGQSDRAGLYNLAKACNWNTNALIKKLATKSVNVDCSSFCATVINLAYGTELVRCFTTSTMFSECYITGKFKVMELKYIDNKWHKGDMPLKAGKHVIINV